MREADTRAGGLSLRAFREEVALFLARKGKTLPPDTAAAVLWLLAAADRSAEKAVSWQRHTTPR